MVKEKAVDKKRRVGLRDLPPRENPKGGGGMMRSEPPLPIPPPGFVVTRENPGAE
ncbi:MAG TPA: hypothetical protein VF551_02765 [Chthoniobacterales bacterium]